MPWLIFSSRYVSSTPSRPAAKGARIMPSASQLTKARLPCGRASSIRVRSKRGGIRPSMAEMATTPRVAATRARYGLKYRAIRSRCVRDKVAFSLSAPIRHDP
ncbi:hypothetical protein D3C86_1631870 [compost metagenome]